jgi:hypothetical protein
VPRDAGDALGGYNFGFGGFRLGKSAERWLMDEF